jgi:hypothetical protein
MWKQTGLINTSFFYKIYPGFDTGQASDAEINTAKEN